MKLDADAIKDVVAEMKAAGYEAGLRDVSYVLLSRLFSEPVYAFRAVFGVDGDFQSYRHSGKVDALTDLMRRRFPEPEEKEMTVEDVLPEEERTKPSEGLSFDEIKRGLEEDLQSLTELRDQKTEDGIPVLEAKEMAAVVGRIADIRVKLTEKFGTTERTKDRVVVVNQKYNDICPYCNHEIAVRR